MYAIFKQFVQDESGATAIEYGLIALLVGLGILTGARTLHNSIEEQFKATANSVKTIN